MATARPSEKKVWHKMSQARRRGEKQLAVLVDPDKSKLKDFDQVLELVAAAKVDYLFVGGSLVVEDRLDHCIRQARERTEAPIVLFPGSNYQLHPDADAVLFLSLISGRNPDYLIGQHVIAAPYIRQLGLEAIPTGYMLVDGGTATTASYMSNTQSIPHHKNSVAICTAMAGEMLGLQIVYLDAGSGASRCVSESMIDAVSRNISVPLLVGGGIRTPEKARLIAMNGADILVVGHAIENNPRLIMEMAEAIHSLNVTA